jgi:hypothetical protein
VSPEIITPTYSLEDGAFQIVDETVTTTVVPASLLCPQFAYLPLVLRARP